MNHVRPPSTWVTMRETLFLLLHAELHGPSVRALRLGPYITDIPPLVHHVGHVRHCVTLPEPWLELRNLEQSGVHALCHVRSITAITQDQKKASKNKQSAWEHSRDELLRITFEHSKLQQYCGTHS